MFKQLPLIEYSFFYDKDNNRTVIAEKPRGDYFTFNFPAKRSNEIIYNTCEMFLKYYIVKEMIIKQKLMFEFKNKNTNEMYQIFNNAEVYFYDSNNVKSYIKQFSPHAIIEIIGFDSDNNIETDHISFLCDDEEWSFIVDAINFTEINHKVDNPDLIYFYIDDHTGSYYPNWSVKQSNCIGYGTYYRAVMEARRLKNNKLKKGN